MVSNNNQSFHFIKNKTKQQNCHNYYNNINIDLLHTIVNQNRIILALKFTFVAEGSFGARIIDHLKNALLYI